MTTQIEAMKNALAAMEHSQEVMLNECGIGYIDVRAITALRAAIEAAEKVELPYEAGCDYCNHPLFIGRKCKACGKEHWNDEEETHS